MTRLTFLLLMLLIISANTFAEKSLYVPIGGNAWIAGSGNAKITEEGVINWEHGKDVLEVYVRLAKAGKLHLFLNGKSSGVSRLGVSILGKSKKVNLKNGVDQTSVGTWIIKSPGYIKISIQGISKTTSTFAELNGLTLEGSAVDEQTAFVKDNNDSYFYWGRRGPSTHLSYTMPVDEDIEWFYNEVTVPAGQDVEGSYYMANGFGEGYFGMQVNSKSERRILFSVWSPFHTDDPKSIPKDKQIVMLEKGTEVYTGEFGNEGAGGQSYLKYNWKAGNTYRFLLRGKPNGDSTTIYSAYFFAPEENKWRLIASFKRPQTHTYLKRFHSFLENFIPEMGNVGRQVYFGNQWVKNASGKWTEMTQAKFTADATARKGYRMDYGGGKDKNLFFLKNCGFFSDYTTIGEKFDKQASGKQPDIDFKLIDQLSANISNKP